MKTNDSANNLALYFTGKIGRIRKGLLRAITTEFTNVPAFTAHVLLSKGKLSTVLWLSSFSPIRRLCSCVSLSLSHIINFPPHSSLDYILKVKHTIVSAILKTNTQKLSPDLSSLCRSLCFSLQQNLQQVI